MATDPKATPEKTTAPAAISADDAKKAAAGEGVTAQDVIAVVSKGADGKTKVTHYTGEEWKAYVAKVAKGEEKLPDVAQTVKLKDGKVLGDPEALTQKDVVEAHTFSVQREAAKDDLEKIGADQKPHAAAVVVDKDGNTVSEKVFKTQEEYQAFVKNKGKDLTVGEGQRAVFAEFDKDGKIVAGRYGTHQEPGQAGLEKGVAEGEKAEKEQQGKKNWLENMMEKAMESGNIAIMAIAMLAMVMTNRNGDREAPEHAGAQPPAGAGYDGTDPRTAAGAAPAAMVIREVNTNSGGMEKVQVSGGMTAEQVAEKFGLADNKAVVEELAKQISQKNGLIEMNLVGDDALGKLPPPTVAAAPSQSTAPVRS